MERGEAGALGIPLIPADQGPDPPHPGVEDAEAQITRGEVELFVVGRIVGDVHLAVQAGHPAVCVEHDGGVVIQPRRPPLEHRSDHDNALVLRRAAQRFGAWPRHRLRQIEQRGVLALGEVA